MFDVNPNLLNQIQEKFGEQIFLLNAERALTFAELIAEAHILSNSLKVKPQERVALSAENQEFLLKAMLALWMREAVAVAVNPKENNYGYDTNYELNAPHSKFKTQNSKLKIQNSKLKTQNLINPESWATIIFTSGSSGKPKAVVHSLANHFYSALGANQKMPLAPGDRWLLSLPLFHVGGLAIFFRTLLSGATMVIADQNRKLRRRKSLAENIKKYQITHLSLVPTQLHRLLQTPEGQSALQKLKLILLGGAPIPETLLEQAEKLGLNLKTTYGNTEMASQIYTGKQVLPFRELRISADEEIELRGKTRFLGYWESEPYKNGLHQPFDEDGWFKSGDLGTLKNGVLSVFGRKDNMFISGGENIHPEEIERVLLEFETVEQVLVVAVRDEEFGARPVAFLKTSESFRETELREFLQQKLVRFKIPDLFLSWPESLEEGLKPQRKELIKLAEFEKASLIWQAQFPLGWMRIALSEGRQIFMVLDLREAQNFRHLFVRAASRKEVMEWLLAPENRQLLKTGNDPYNDDAQNVKWFPTPKIKRGAVRESFEIIRLLESEPYSDPYSEPYSDPYSDPYNELPENEIQLYDARARGTFKASLTMISLPPRTQRSEPYGEKTLKDDDWPWDFPEAVFQSGVYLPEFETGLARMYLLRCLYRRTDDGKQFLGWKVHLLRSEAPAANPADAENLAHPFWEVSLEEEIALEAHLRRCGLFPEPERPVRGTPPQVNTPLRERQRRVEFQSKIESVLEISN